MGTDTIDPAFDPVAILARLAARPTAPFHEAGVAREIVALCRQAGLACEVDRFGNLLVWHRGPGARGRPIAFSAHMDHPALDVVETEPLTGRLLGGVPGHYFDRRVPIRFIFISDDESAGHDAVEVPGWITGRFESETYLGLTLEAARPVVPGSFAVFDVGPFREDGDVLYQPAADDLAGCAAILSTLIRCARESVAAVVAGVFTRCEEVGLVGATLVARQRLLPAGTVVVSLEASLAMPGGEIGAGPVIRVGDATMAFHPEGEALLRRARVRLLASDPEVPIQRQLMSGGTCEAVAFALAGYVTSGVAFPLGNYHNAGPDGIIAPEYIHRRDLETGAALLFATAECAGEEVTPEPVAERLNGRADAAAGRLERTALTWKV
jgi:endoglucanase